MPQKRPLSKSKNKSKNKLIGGTPQMTLKVYPKAGLNGLPSIPTYVFVDHGGNLSCISALNGMPDVVTSVVDNSTLKGVYDSLAGFVIADTHRVMLFFDVIHRFRTSCDRRMLDTDHYTPPSSIKKMLDQIRTVENDVHVIIDSLNPLFTDGLLPSNMYMDFDDSHFLSANETLFQHPPSHPPVASVISLKHYTNRLMSPFVAPKRGDMQTGNRPVRVLWLGCGDTWRNLLQEEGRKAPLYVSVYTLDTTRMFLLDSAQATRDFFERFHTDDRKGIDWEKVREQEPTLSGIFAPRPRVWSPTWSPWTRTWDVCSAAIWSSDCIMNTSRQQKLHYNLEEHDRRDYRVSNLYMFDTKRSQVQTLRRLSSDSLSYNTEFWVTHLRRRRYQDDKVFVLKVFYNESRPKHIHYLFVQWHLDVYCISLHNACPDVVLVETNNDDMLTDLLKIYLEMKNWTKDDVPHIMMFYAAILEFQESRDPNMASQEMSHVTNLMTFIKVLMGQANIIMNMKLR